MPTPTGHFAKALGPSKLVPLPTIVHNGLPVKFIAQRHYHVADFRGRYVSVVADSAKKAIEQFVAAKACNYDTPYDISRAWRDAGCPSREEWQKLLEQNRTFERVYVQRLDPA